MTIRYLFDIGGTHIRTAFLLKGNIYGLKKEKHNLTIVEQTTEFGPIPRKLRSWH